MTGGSAYATLRDAIKKKVRVEAYFKNYFRVFCVYAIGSKQDVPRVLAYQVGGGDVSGVVTPSHGIWLCMDVADVVGPMHCQGEWVVGSEVPEPARFLDTIDEVAVLDNQECSE